MDTKDDIEVEEMEKIAKEESFERGELIMSIAERLREEGMEKGIEKGKLEERKEVAVKLLTKRFGKELTEELKEKILKTNEKTIDYPEFDSWKEEMLGLKRKKAGLRG